MKCKSKRALQPQISKTPNWATLLIGNNIYDMKKLLNLLCLFAVLASSCSREELLVDEAATSLNDIIFTAGFEQETRTYIQDGTFLRWNEGDQISIFVANTLNRQYKFDGETGDNGGTFSVVDAPFGTGNDLACHYAVYPYAEGVKITEKGVVTTALPAEQSYAENSFGLGANTMVAVTKDTDDTFLKFRNVCGYLMLQLYGNNITVKSITLTGNNDEKLAGKATVTPLYGQEPTIAMSDDATTSITLNCGDGVKLGASAETATAFWIVVPPTTFDEGFEITVTDVNGNTFTKTTSKEVAIERNVIKPMAAFEVEIEEIIPNNQIWYTSTAKVEPYISDYWSFGAKIVSNEWDSTTGKGIITFDEDVTSIGESAFYGCSSLTSITIPDSVTWIYGYAFNYCSNLTSITIPDSVTGIGGWAFCNCASLTSVTISDNVTSIGELVFAGCNSLTEFKGKFASNDGRCWIIKGTLISFAPSGLSEYTIPDSVTFILEYAFAGCNSLTSVTIPNSVTWIGDYAFWRCASLTSVTIGNGVTEIGGYAFKECSSLTSVTIPDSVTHIGYGAFSGCSSLTSITIPDSVTYIGGSAFNECSRLTSITIPDGVTEIGDWAFGYCFSLTSITIPDSVTTIGNSAFSNCTGLTSITIPDGVTEIGDWAFYECSSLKEVYCKPTTPPTGGYDMFDGCTSEPQIFVPAASVETYKAADGWRIYAFAIEGYDF